MTFGERLRQLRLAQRTNQRTLAARVGIDFTYLSKIETGAMLPPSAETSVKLAQALHASADELLLLANKVPEDLRPVITQSPLWPAFLLSSAKMCPMYLWPRPFFARWRLEWPWKLLINRCRPKSQTRQLSIDKPGIRRKWLTFSVTRTR